MKNFALLLLTILFFSCSSDDDNNSDQLTSVRLVKVEREDNVSGPNFTIDYAYNSNDQLISTTRTSENGVSVITYNYNANGKIDNISQIPVTYTSELITTIGDISYIYDNNDFLVEIVLDNCSYYHTKDSNENTIEISASCSNTIGVIEHDNENNPFRTAFPLEMSKIHNHGENNEIFISDTAGEVNFVYTYNSLGYPITKTDFSNNTQLRVTTYFYE